MHIFPTTFLEIAVYTAIRNNYGWISDQEKEIRDQAIKGRGSGIKDQ